MELKTEHSLIEKDKGKQIFKTWEWDVKLEMWELSATYYYKVWQNIFAEDQAFTL